MFHEAERTELTVTFEGEVPTVSEAELLLIESFLDDVIQAVLQNEKG